MDRPNRVRFPNQNGFVAELVDALALGASIRKDVRVRVPSCIARRFDCSELFYALMLSELGWKKSCINFHKSDEDASGFVTPQNWDLKTLFFLSGLNVCSAFQSRKNKQ